MSQSAKSQPSIRLLILLRWQGYLAVQVVQEHEGKVCRCKVYRCGFMTSPSTSVDWDGEVHTFERA